VPPEGQQGRRVARLPVQAWPGRVVLLPAVDAESDEPVIFTRDSGVALADAVAASCAVPGVWPPLAGCPRPSPAIMAMIDNRNLERQAGQFSRSKRDRAEMTAPGSCADCGGTGPVAAVWSGRMSG
jgi:hypothetical protein